MLVDLTRIQESVDDAIAMLKEYYPHIPEEKYPYHILGSDEPHPEKGIYITPDFFLEFFFEETLNLKYEDKYWSDGDVDSYGVADNLEQIKEYYAKQILDPVQKYFISVTPVKQDKSNAGKGVGWRWHKWGEYIGKFSPQCEYLNDEDFGPEFDGYVIIFHCYKINS